MLEEEHAVLEKHRAEQVRCQVALVTMVRTPDRVAGFLFARWVSQQGYIGVGLADRRTRGKQRRGLCGKLSMIGDR